MKIISAILLVSCMRGPPDGIYDNPPCGADGGQWVIHVYGCTGLIPLPSHLCEGDVHKRDMLMVCVAGQWVLADSDYRTDGGMGEGTQ